MQYKLHIKLIISYLFMTFFLVGVIAIVSNITFEKEFEKYVINTQQEENNKLVNKISNEYIASNDNWQNINLEKIGVEGLEDGLIIKIIDNKGIVLWDAMEHNSGICANMLEDMARNMKERYPNFDGKYMDKHYSIKVNNVEVGKVIIGYYGPYYFSKSDMAFLDTFNNVLFLTAFIAILVSIALGIVISRKITTSITNVIKTTKEIACGNYKQHIDQKSNTKEIIVLMNSVNNLAKTLDKQDQSRKDLTSDIAHELRTPITTLRSHLEAVKDGVWELTQDRVDSLYEEVIRISKIINDLDKLNSYDHLQPVLEKKEFSIKELLTKTIDNFDTSFNEKSITVMIEGKDQQVLGEPDKIKQVFINLISNSLKYTDNHGHINIIITSTHSNVSITVKDDGIGISSEDLPHIFERFYRADKSRTRETGGSGIGLSIVKNIVEAHNGTISAKSTLNEGTSITVTLPR